MVATATAARAVGPRSAEQQPAAPSWAALPGAADSPHTWGAYAVTVLLPLAIGSLTIALLVSCSHAAPVSPRPLAGSSWILTAVAAERAMRPSVDASASLNFGADGTIAGSTGCNRFTGTWTAQADRLTIAPGATTMRGCPDQLGAQEAAVLAALGATHRFRRSGESLVLLGSDGVVLAQYRAAAGALAGTSWQATGVNNGRGGVVSTTATGALSLTFAGDGTVSGFDGCGAFAGSFATDGARISIDAEPAVSCGDPEQLAYLSALRNATTWRVDGNRLELRDDEGALQAGLVQA